MPRFQHLQVRTCVTYRYLFLLKDRNRFFNSSNNSCSSCLSLAVLNFSRLTLRDSPGGSREAFRLRLGMILHTPGKNMCCGQKQPYQYPIAQTGDSKLAQRKTKRRHAYLLGSTLNVAWYGSRTKS